MGDLGHTAGIADVSLDSWTCLEGMVDVVKRTGHSSFYVEKSMLAMGKTPTQLGMPGEAKAYGGGESKLATRQDVNLMVHSLSYMVRGQCYRTRCKVDRLIRRIIERAVLSDRRRCLFLGIIAGGPYGTRSRLIVAVPSST